MLTAFDSITFKSSEMKKLTYLFIMIVLNVLRTNAQVTSQPAPYKVPDAYRFDYKVVYQMQDEDNKSPEIVTFCFTKNGDYMSIQSDESRKDKDADFMVMTKDGKMISFGEGNGQNDSGNDKVLTVIDMRSMFSGLGKAIAPLARESSESSKEEASSPEKDNSVNLDNFVRTGRTKQFFGYTADEYSKHVSGYENGRKRSGTVYVWYARVDFDPEMMFSMGLGNIAQPSAMAKMQASHTNNLFGMGIVQKNYLLTELSFTEDGGKTGTPMKVISIDKTNFSKSTAGYKIDNYSGMSLGQMIQKEMQDNNK
jgi:hypothetical protein